MGQFSGPTDSIFHPDSKFTLVPSTVAPSVGCALIDNGPHPTLSNVRLSTWTPRAALFEPLVSPGLSSDYFAADKTWKAIPSASWGGITGSISSQGDLQTALNAKQPTLVSGTNLKTINSIALLGSGDISLANLGLGSASNVTFGGLSLTGTGTLGLPSGTTLQRVAIQGVRWNTDTTRHEFYNPSNATWYNHARLSGDTFTGAIAATNLSGTNTGDTPPGGSGTELQFRSGSSFGALTGSSVSGANLTLGGTLTIPQASISGGTVTTSTPLIDATQTWNNAATVFTGIRLNVTNTASNSSSKLVDFQLGGTSFFAVDRAGQVLVGGSPAVRNTGSNMVTEGLAWWFPTAWFGGAGAPQCALTGDANDTLALRRGVNAQTLNLYGTYTDASNYRRLRLGSTTAGAFTLTAEGLGTGASGNTLGFGNSIIFPTDNTFDIGASGATRPRNAYVGTQVITPSVSGGSTNLELTGGGSLLMCRYRLIQMGSANTGEVGLWTDSTSGGLRIGNGGVNGTNFLPISASSGIFTGNTVTASTPLVNSTQTWNNAAITFIGATTNITDTLSAAGSIVERWQVNSTDRFVINKANGSIAVGTASGSGSWGTMTSGVTITLGRPQGGNALDSGSEVLEWQSNGQTISSRGIHYFGTTIAARDAGIRRVSAGVLGTSDASGTGYCDFNAKTITSAFQTLTVDPISSDIPAGSIRFVKNTTLNEIRLWANDGGSMKKSAALA